MDRYEPNPFPLPQIQHEEMLSKPLALSNYEYDWSQGIPVSERLFHHHTLASIRQYCLLRQPCAPKDSLDIMLSAVYDHGTDSFQPRSWIYVQPETVGLPTFRLLKNKRFMPATRPARDLRIEEVKFPEASTVQVGTKWHGIKMGGINERKNVHSVKLGITSNHGAQSNRGFSRKVDGTFYSQ